ncbi:hypothetical protein ACM66B_002050 [Microbotryomycetes sp. NB124-2]
MRLLAATFILALSTLARANTESLTISWPLDARSGLSTPSLKQLVWTATPLALGVQTSWHGQLDANRTAQQAHLVVEHASSDAQGHVNRLLSLLSDRVGLNARHVRLCWPASQPTDYKLDVYADATGQSYVIVTAVASSVPFPSSDVPDNAIDYTLLIERALFGGVPASTVPIVLSIVLVVAVLVGLGVPQAMVTCLHQIIGTRSEARNCKDE